MFHPRNGIAPAQKTQDTTSRLRQGLVERQFETRFNQLHVGEQVFQPLSLKASNMKLHQIEMKAAYAKGGRKEVNTASTSVMRTRGQQNAKAGQIESRLNDSEGTLQDIGEAHLARAAFLKENAFKLNAAGHQGQVTSEAMFARNASRGAIAGAIQEEVHGIAALEGRTGLQARTGLKEEDLDAYIAKTGAGPLVDQHALENTRQAEVEQKSDQPVEKLTPQEHWGKLRETLSADDFNKKVFEFRARQIKSLYGDPNADRDTRVAYTAARKMNLEANEAGFTSSQSLRINQRLVSSLPESSEGREGMIAIRTITLDQRRNQKAADTASR